MLSRRFLHTAFFAALSASLLAAPAAHAADPIGAAVRVVNKVTAEANQASRTLAMGSGVNQNEIIAVAPDSLGELRLKDETKLALGPGSRMKLDKFVYDPDRATGTIAVDLTKGAFRFITGVARKPSYLIRSPNASISVRGTIFDVYVDAAGTMWLLLHEGSIEVCNSRGECRLLDDPCEVVRVGAGGDLSLAATWNRQPAVREVSFETAFPFVVNPPQVDPAPRHTRALVETGTCPAAGGIPSPPTTPTRRADIDPLPEAPAPAPALPGPAPRSSEPARSDNFEPAEPAPYRPEPAPYRPAPPATVRSAEPASAPIEASEPVDYTPQDVPPPVTAYMPESRWSGVYVGFTAGSTFSDKRVDVGCSDPTFTFDPVATDCSYTRNRGYLASAYNPDDIGFAGGGVVGFNVQMGPIVLGLETDITRMNASGYASKSVDVPGFYDSNGTVKQDLQWLGTLRGRVGVASGNVLIFATGGMAYGEVDMGYDLSFRTTRDYARAERTETLVGWTAGGGAELGLGKISLKGEYMYFDLGTEQVSANYVVVGSGPPGPTTTDLRPEFENTGHIARVGLNFHLD